MGLRLNFDEFYAITIKHLRSEFVTAPKNYESISHVEISQYCVGMFPNGRPEVFIQTGGGDKKAPRAIIASSLNLNLYHKDIISVFEKLGFTGWESYPVKIYKRNGDLIDGYHAFSIKGKCGKYDLSKSKIINYTRDYGGNIVTEKRYQGFYFNPDSWDGSDIFSMENKGWVNIVAEPVMRELIKFNTHLNYERLSEYIHLEEVELNIL